MKKNLAKSFVNPFFAFFYENFAQGKRIKICFPQMQITE